MKKTINLIAAIIFTISFATAQTIADAVKNLNYGKNKTAKEQLQKMYAANDKDASTIYWLGQSMIAVDDVKGAKALYQKSLQAGVNEALLYVAMAHVNLLEGGDWNAANQKFESAITTSAETRGKNKGKAPVSILNAIGRANCIGHIADGSSKFGNPEYAVDKLTLASMIDATNTECLIYKGLCYRKMGGEFGGEAQKAYTEALSRNPNLPQANYLIGKIYLSQQNKPFMEQYFNAALANDITYAPVYLDYYNYYSNRDVSVAKGYIEKYIQYADKDCNNDYSYADYLFRAGNNQASLTKAKELENSDCKMRVPVLYAYNYDRLNDSIQAKTNIEKFFATATPDKILASDYDIAAKIYARFPGSELQAINALNKLIEFDNSKATQLQYLPVIADLYAKAKNYQEQIKIIQKLGEIRGNVSEYDYYKMSEAAIAGNQFNIGMEIAKKYLTAYSEKPQGYDYLVKNAKKIDTANTTSLLFDAIKIQNAFLIKDTAKYKQKLINNYYIQMAYYNDVLKDYNKAIEYCDEILILVPNEPQTLKIREALKKNAEKKTTPATSPKTPAKPAKSTGATTNTKKDDKSKKK
jgi:Flp pilus assembly protein TadD